jgi:hypothetical protein
MTQDPGTNSSFHVDSGEAVTVTVTAVHCANLTTAAFNGKAVAQTPVDSGVYPFEVDGTSADTATVPLKFVCTCNFIAPPAGAPEPSYSVSVQGADGKAFDGPTVRISVPKATFTLSFRINAIPNI